MNMSTTLHLDYHPPLTWPQLLEFFSHRAIRGVEFVADQRYRRTVALLRKGKPATGWICLQQAADRDALELTVSDSLQQDIEEIARRIAQQFDLHCRPEEIHAVLGDLSRPWPGLRVPGAFDGFEAVVRGILGQQITVAAASTLAGRLATTLGTPLTTPWPELSHAFPAPEHLAAAHPDELGRLGIVSSRIRAIQGLAGAVEQGALTLQPGADVPATMTALKKLHGIGEWTAQYAAMRALKWADAFPASDYGILKALGVDKPAQAKAMAEAWRPWRAYAAMCLWQSLAAS